MKFQPKYVKTHPKSQILLLESVIDKTGNLYYAVTLDENQHFLFCKLSSAIDFINSNFV